MTLDKFISPSIMVPKIYEYAEYIKLFDRYNLSVIHFDVIDGHFVPNIMLGSSVFDDLKVMTNIPLDIHLMVTQPENYIPMFNVTEGDWISFHPETTNQPYRLLQTIKELGCRAGLVISPGTPISYVEESIDQLDYVTLMTVNPGFVGQTLVPNTFDKIRRIRDLLDSHANEIDLVVDGNTTPGNSINMAKSGANGFVVGSASNILKSPSTFGKFYKEYMTNFK